MKDRSAHFSTILFRFEFPVNFRTMHLPRSRSRTRAPYTLFSFAGKRLKFRAPQCLRRYLNVKKWNDGYLEVDADYGDEFGVVEEYIDLRPVLKCLMISPKSFLRPIRNVEIVYA